MVGSGFIDSEFFCKVAFVDVVEACAGSAPDPQTAWGSLLLRECTVPCYVNLMPWYTACGEQLQTFQELSAEQVAIIQLQRTVCADYYGPYTGAKDEQFMLYNFCRVNSSENGRSQVLLRRWRRMRFRYSTTWSKLKGRLAPTLPLRTPGWCRRAFKKSTRTKRPQ